MIDFNGLPLPDDAPEPGACVRAERPADGLVRLHLEPPHRPKLAVLDVPLLRDLQAELEHARTSGCRGLVITGREPLSFAGGADVEAIATLTDPMLADRIVRAGQQVFQGLFEMSRCGGGRIFTVAAVGGPVPGGACELALACDRILLADDPKSRIGLPEVLLGIFPGWGGTQRLPRRVGVPAALDMILTGKLLRARKALKLGVVDRLTPPEYLWRIADDLALGKIKCKRRERAGMSKWLVDKNPLAGAIISSQARKTVLAKTKGHFPAPLVALPLVVGAPRTSLAQGLRNELASFQPLVVGKVSKNLVALFLESERAKKLGRLANDEKARGFARAAVIGAGVMGGGIASLLAEKGTPTRLRDLDQAQLDAAQRDHYRTIAKKRQRRRLEPHRADAAVDRLEVTTEAVGFGRCDFAIEAVAERLEVKRAVLGELAETLPEDAVLATNTSSLSVDAIAETLPRPERVVGMHFFNPVRMMPLVEVVRGKATSDETVARTAALAVALGKTPVVVKDVAGFLVNRVLGPYLDEAIRLLEAGVDPQAIDRALVDFGMPMGPCELIDQVGLDIAQHAGASLEEAYGERCRASRYLAPLVEAKQLGVKTGAGIYLWRENKQKKPERGEPNPQLPPRGDRSLGANEITDRLVLAMVNEAARCLAEDVVAGPGELDLATVFGTGFAPFRGGVLRYADACGARNVVERLQRVAADPIGEGRAERFEPAPILLELAEADRTFHETPPRS